ncbi:GPN-loop GTPase 1 isoform 2 [Schistosoma japonicum]|uniref:GPN-loop GTPase n=1 Tax=Schistosoma japonicum TaxID=6182 RepID=A0A4Z2DLP5_SCHJA|nr:GPN-loop GTPase 1 isoform 2 [Schistosoma japonicum]
MNQLGADLRTKPVCLIVLGMAGSGKTTFVKKLTEHFMAISSYSYAINLDPAVHHVPYNLNIDIRDTVNFKEVMKQYGYGPNGAIMTSLNFFASQFHKVVDMINNSSSKISFVVIDTPGQIEVFTWSASGTIITELLGNSFPTLIVYVMDTPRSHNPITFMSNMLYACSVLYKMGLPFILVLNKTDIIESEFAIRWMRDFETFQDALGGHRQSTEGPSELECDNPSYPGTSPYMNSLIHSMSLVLDEFYSTLRCCSISSITGEGLTKFLDEVDQAKEEYFKINLPRLQAKQKIYKTVPIGASGEPYSFRPAPMLLDLVGDNDEAENDPLPDVNGIETRPHSDSDDEKCSGSFRTYSKYES